MQFCWLLLGLGPSWALYRVGGLEGPVWKEALSSSLMLDQDHPKRMGKNNLGLAFKPIPLGSSRMERAN